MKNLLRIPIKNASKAPICINCKHYLEPIYNNIKISDKKKGFCKKSGTIHVVDGTIEYEYVEIYREYTCKGNEYEEATIKVSYESLDNISY